MSSVERSDTEVVIEKIRGLPARFESNEEYDPISEETVNVAITFLERLIQVLGDDESFLLADMTIGTEGFGQITFYWWLNFTTLSFIVYPDGMIKHIRDWGIHMRNDMEFGDITEDDAMIIEIWQAFINQTKEHVLTRT